MEEGDQRPSCGQVMGAQVCIHTGVSRRVSPVEWQQVVSWGLLVVCWRWLRCGCWSEGGAGSRNVQSYGVLRGH